MKILLDTNFVITAINEKVDFFSLADELFSDKIEYSDLTYKGDTLVILVKAKGKFNHNNQVQTKFLNEIIEGSNSLAAMELHHVILVVEDSLGVSKTLARDVKQKAKDKMIDRTNNPVTINIEPDPGKAGSISLVSVPKAISPAPSLKIYM